MLCLRFAVTHQHDFLKYPDQSSIPKGLRDKSARAVTGRGQTAPPQWGGGRLFNASAEFFFTKTAVTWKQKAEKWF